MHRRSSQSSGSDQSDLFESTYDFRPSMSMFKPMVQTTRNNTNLQESSQSPMGSKENVTQKSSHRVLASPALSTASITSNLENWNINSDLVKDNTTSGNPKESTPHGYTFNIHGDIIIRQPTPPTPTKPDYSYEEVPVPTRRRDSITAVISVPNTGNFMDIKMEAVKTWNEGKDIAVFGDEPEKKKSAPGWLSPSDFCSDESISVPVFTVPNSDVASSQAQPVNNEDATRPATCTPEWGLEGEPGQQEQSEIPNWYEHDNQPVSHNGNWEFVPPPAVMVPSPALALETMSLTQIDAMVLHFVYEFLHNRHRESAIASFKGEVSRIIRYYLPALSTRTFGLLFEALVVLLDHDNSTGRSIRDNWITFGPYLNQHLQNYVNTLGDLLTIILLCIKLKSCMPDFQNNLPMDTLVRVHASLKNYCTPEENKEFMDYIGVLQTAVPDIYNSSDNGSPSVRNDQRHLGRDNLSISATQHHDNNAVPSFPNGLDIVSEALNFINVLKQYEEYHDSLFVNQDKGRWSDIDLLNYMLVHYLLLRSEVVGPVENAIKFLFSNRSLNLSDDCSIFAGAKPRSTTTLVSSSEPGVVFEFVSTRGNQIYTMKDRFKEGSFVLLIPESLDIVNPLDRKAAKQMFAIGSMIGQAICASSNPDYPMVTLHINNSDLARLDWSNSYTIITSRLNASAAFSVLRWLYRECADLDKTHFSRVITPRLLTASNDLTPEQLNVWSEAISHSMVCDEGAIPEYLADAEINIDCIIKNKEHDNKAKHDVNGWPSRPSELDDFNPFGRHSLYSLSESQLKAVKYALSNKIAVIQGAPGTGKTLVATKLVELVYEPLRNGQYNQPILVITKSEVALDTILSSVIKNIPDIIRFGGEPWDDTLDDKQATAMGLISSGEPSHYHQYQKLERGLKNNQCKLKALFKARFQAVHHDPGLISTAIASPYLPHLQNGYLMEYNENYIPGDKSIWKAWAVVDQKTEEYADDVKSIQESKDQAQWIMEDEYLKATERGLLPIIDSNILMNRFNAVFNSRLEIVGITENVHWPFESSNSTVDGLRANLLKAWKSAIPQEDQVWQAQDDTKIKLVDTISQILVTFIDYEIQDILNDQVEIAKDFDDMLFQRWTHICRFNRVIGMTSDFAAARRDWVSTLWPRTIIVDEASEILESTVASIILGTHTEHVILLGDNLSKPRLSNLELSGSPKNMDVSLMERWKGAENGVVLLKEQWRMHPDVALVIDQFNLEDSSLTASMVSGIRNMVDGKYPDLQGITRRAYYIRYQAVAEDEALQNVIYSVMLNIELSEAEVNEARYVAFFGLYLSQQPTYPRPSVSILTSCTLQKDLIKAIIKREVPYRTRFIANLKAISVNVIEDYAATQSNFVIVSTATPGGSCSFYDNVLVAFTRSRFGFFVVGIPGKHRIHPRWEQLAQYMEVNGLLGEKLELYCNKHEESIPVEGWKGFDEVKNGGCSNNCGELLEDGYLCEEDCHPMPHNYYNYH